MRPVPINDPEAVIEVFLDSEIALTTGVMRVDTERSDSGAISYVYNDPIAEKRVAGRTRIRERVAGITIGRLAGDACDPPQTTPAPGPRHAAGVAEASVRKTSRYRTRIEETAGR